MNVLHFKKLIEFMIIASSMNKLSGPQKKEFVLNSMRKYILFNNEIEDIMIFIIDSLIDVENGKLVINRKVRSKCWKF